MTFLSPKSKTQTKGKAAEESAKKYLENTGLIYVEENYHCKSGEIDLIMREQNVFVFVEVKSRSNTRYGLPAETVTSAKQTRIRKTAQHFLQRKNLYEKVPLRFDVVTLDGQHINWIKGAF